MQTVGYSAAGVGLAAWIALEGVRRVTPYRRRLLPAVLGVIAAGALYTGHTYVLPFAAALASLTS